MATFSTSSSTSSLTSSVSIPSPDRQSYLSSVLVGALICLILQVAFTFLGVGVGLAVIPIEKGLSDASEALTWSAAIYGTLTLVISFFVGGYISSRLSNLETKWTAGIHGFSVFSLVSLGLIFFADKPIVSFLGDTVSKAGIGIVAKSDTVVDQISRARIVTDMSLLKGKIVTQLVIPDQKGMAVEGDVIKNFDKKAPRTEVNKPKVVEAIKDARQVVSQAGLGAFSALLVGGLSAVMGGVVGRRKEEEQKSLGMSRVAQTILEGER